MRLAILLSGSGTNFKAIADAIADGRLKASIGLVGSNLPGAPGLELAARLGFKTAVFDRKSFAEGEEFARHFLDSLAAEGVDFIVLAGYLRKLPPAVARAFKERAVNIHPALLPDFGGKGMFGIHVHEGVIAGGAVESGVTVHYVDEIYDNGAIIAQRRVTVNADDTPESLQLRVLELEHAIYPEVLQRLAMTEHVQLMH